MKYIMKSFSFIVCVFLSLSVRAEVLDEFMNKSERGRQSTESLEDLLSYTDLDNQHIMLNSYVAASVGIISESVDIKYEADWYYNSGEFDYDGELEGDLTEFSISYGKISDDSVTVYSYRFKGGEQDGELEYDFYSYSWGSSASSFSTYSTQKVSEHEFRFLISKKHKPVMDKVYNQGYFSGAMIIRKEDRVDSIQGPSPISWLGNKRELELTHVNFICGGGYIFKKRISRFLLGARGDLDIGFGFTSADDSIDDYETDWALYFGGNVSAFADIDFNSVSLFLEVGSRYQSMLGQFSGNRVKSGYGRIGLRSYW